MRPSAWFVASCALILCTLRLTNAAKGQRQCSEVRDATAEIPSRVLPFSFKTNKQKKSLEDNPTKRVCGC